MDRASLGKEGQYKTQDHGDNARENMIVETTSKTGNNHDTSRIGKEFTQVGV